MGETLGFGVIKCIYVGYSWCPIPWVLGSFSAISIFWENFRICHFQNATSPTAFVRYHPNFMKALLTMGECSLLLFLAIGQVLKKLWHFKILTLESMGKPKMWSVSKTADRRAKRTKLQYYSTHMEVNFGAWFLFVLFGVIHCTSQNFHFCNFWKSSLPIFIQFIQTLYKVS